MQAALYFTPCTFPKLIPTRSIASSRRSTTQLESPRIKGVAATVAAYDTSIVDYSPMTSVFPAEACETVGGDACDVDMYPEVKLNPEANSNTANKTRSAETVDREYLEYNSPKTVFPGEACDDLGGEFCEPDYQRGVY